MLIFCHMNDRVRLRGVAQCWLSWHDFGFRFHPWSFQDKTTVKDRQLLDLSPNESTSTKTSFKNVSLPTSQQTATVPSPYYLGLKLIQICKSNFALVSMFYPTDTCQQSISLVNTTYKIDFNLDLPSLYCLSSKLLSFMVLPNPLLQSYPYSTFLVLCC